MRNEGYQSVNVACEGTPEFLERTNTLTIVPIFIHESRKDFVLLSHDDSNLGNCMNIHLGCNDNPNYEG